MNAIYLVLGAAFVFVLAYRYYGAFIAAKVLTIDESRITPAHQLEDGQDYVPTNKWVVFGHHFAAISGAGPLVGPVLAAQFGYAPGFFWILAGAVLAGAVHDLVILFASVRHRGRSLTEIAREEVGPVTKVAGTVAVLLIVLLAMAGLAIVVVHALKDNVWGTFTIGTTIPIALFIGIYMRYLRPGKIGEASVIGATLVLLSVAAGPYVKQSALASWFMFDEQQLKIILPAYGFVAAALPVWLLLAPRDYLSSYLKIGTVFALAFGVLMLRPEIHMPAFTTFVYGGGPIIPGPVWPFVFITIACGAISGFHALISSGTTPKLLNSEKDMLMVGYGAMLMEGLVASMALVAACVLLPGDYFAINTSPAAFEKLAASGNELFRIVNLPQLSQMVDMDLAGRTGGGVSLAVGMAYIFSSLPGLKGWMAYLYQFSIVFEALFILTTIDAGTRVARYILQDALGNFYTPFKQVSWVPGMLLSSIVVSLGWGYLLYGGTVSSIWPIFGTSNQLLATIALAIGTTVILRRTKNWIYSLITALPMIFLGVTTITAGILSIYNSYLPKGMILNTVLMVMMIVLILIIIVDAIRSWFKAMAKESPNYVDVHYKPM
ncbi:carbon starvation protein A [Heliobacterium chlorum]|uniref:Carbon starvation protein A n=1 Tax=Heliobacterium chlorum TaxID=2698 RepID=A0ABR7T283_HELCL|nr:carbon starvation protein A [Heliobacterium chlorum]